MLRLLLSVIFAAHLFAETRFDLLLQGAVDNELQPFLSALRHKREVQVGAWTFWTGHIGKKAVVISRTEQGPINAVAATTVAIERFHPRAIINQGTAGAHNRKLKLYDIVVGEFTTDYSGIRTDHADEGKGTSLTRWRIKPHMLRLDNRNITEFFRFPGTVSMVEAAAQIPNPHGRVFKGNIGSAYQFHREIDTIAWFHKVFGTDSEDMESAYAAGVATGFGTPFVAIRMISDVEWDHPQFEKIAGQYCAEFVLKFAQSLP